MSTERDIIIERLEQKLAAKDREFEQMQESLRETIIAEIENKFADKLKLRESTIDEIRTRFGEKVNEILEMNKSLRDSFVEQQSARSETFTGIDDRMGRLERRFVELNSAYEGVMKELLDQKSIIHELRSKKKEEGFKQDMKPKDEPMSPTYKILDKLKPEARPSEEAKQPEKPKPKGEYIVADNYVPKDKRRQQVIIEAEEKMVVAEEEQKQIFNKPVVKRSERVKEGVEIFETPKRGR